EREESLFDRASTKPIEAGRRCNAKQPAFERRFRRLIGALDCARDRFLRKVVRRSLVARQSVAEAPDSPPLALDGDVLARVHHGARTALENGTRSSAPNAC